MKRDEINPHHPVTEKMSDHWHKVCGMLLHKMGVKRGSGEIVLTVNDVNKLADYNGDVAILIHDRADGLHLKMVTMKEAEELAQKELQ